MMITAVHHAGLVSLTHTPSPMGFLNDILGRPQNERPFLILVVGYPAADAQVPQISEKTTGGDCHFFMRFSCFPAGTSSTERFNDRVQVLVAATAEVDDDDLVLCPFGRALDDLGDGVG